MSTNKVCGGWIDPVLLTEIQVLTLECARLEAEIEKLAKKDKTEERIRKIWERMIGKSYPKPNG